MGIKTFRPVTPSLRATTALTNDEITKSSPEKSLLSSAKKHGGRNNQGQITCRHKGGGHKQKYRIIDFVRSKDNMPGKLQGYYPNGGKIPLALRLCGQPPGLCRRGVCFFFFTFPN